MAIQEALNPEEVARRGDAIYEREVTPTVTSEDTGKYVVIDVTSGAWEMDADEIVASDRLREKHPDALEWLVRVGSRYARRFASRHSRTHS